METKYTCPTCGSDRVACTAIVFINGQVFKEWDREDDAFCLDCNATFDWPREIDADGTPVLSDDHECLVCEMEGPGGHAHTDDNLPTFETYRSKEDGVVVVHIDDTDEIPEGEDGLPIMRIYFGDAPEPIYGTAREPEPATCACGRELQGNEIHQCRPCAMGVPA